MSALVFMDTETTGLSLDDDIWEFAAIRREEDGTESEHHMFIQHSEHKCARLPDSFREDHARRFPSECSGRIVTQVSAAHTIANLTDDKPHIVGAVPNFDTERIARLLLNSVNRRPSWHYHLIDVENLAVGAITATGSKLALPWDSDEISGRVGVQIPVEERHTAMGDVRWAMGIYDAVMGLAE